MKWIWKKIAKLLTRKVIKYVVDEELKSQIEQKERLEETLNTFLNQIRETIHSEERKQALRCFPCYLRAIPIKNFDDRIADAMDLGKQLISFYEEQDLQNMLIEQNILGRFLKSESETIRVKVDEFIRELQPGGVRFRLVCKLSEETHSIGEHRILLGQFEDMIQKGLLGLDDLEEAKNFLTSTHEWKDYEHVKEEAIRLESAIHHIDDFHQRLGQLACVTENKLEDHVNSFINYAKGLDRDFISRRILTILKRRYGKYECVKRFIKQCDRRNQGSLKRYVKQCPISFKYDDGGQKVNIDGKSDMMTLQGLGAHLTGPLVPGQVGIMEIRTDDNQKIEKKSIVVHNRIPHERKAEEGFQYYAGFRLEDEDKIPEEFLNATIE